MAAEAASGFLEMHSRHPYIARLIARKCRTWRSSLRNLHLSVSGMPHIAIIGVGLIGGSLGIAWKKRRSDVRIVGFDNPRVLTTAVERGAIDAGASSAADAVREADIIVLAAPLRVIVSTLDDIAPHVKPGAVVTDVGSVKRPVVDHALDVLPRHVRFIGGHPMAGSERRGVEHADALLFENATYVLCPADGGKALQDEQPAFVQLIRSTGARLLMLDADRHDAIAATVSHLPQFLAVALMNYAADRNASDDAFLQLAAGGFRDMTRIASSPFDVWRDIFIANGDPVLDALAGFTAHLQRLRTRMATDDFSALEEAFETARSARDSIPRDTKGFLHPLADVYVYAEDRPGELLSIARILHDASLNIKDIELLKIREGTGGAFRIGFSDPDVAEAAVEALTSARYTAYRL